MILAFSTSCPFASVAAIDRNVGILWTGRVEAPQGASGACLRLLEELMADLSRGPEDAEMFLADIGPGSFTGVRVGVTLAKTFGFLYEKPVAGASSFDLISADSTVVLPSKKGEYFVREPGRPAFRTVDLPVESFKGFGPGIEDPIWPDASRFERIVDLLEPTAAESFVPEYLIEPSISVPKTPFRPAKEPNG